MYILIFLLSLIGCPQVECRWPSIKLNELECPKTLEERIQTLREGLSLEVALASLGLQSQRPATQWGNRRWTISEYELQNRIIEIRSHSDPDTGQLLFRSARILPVQKP